MRGGILLAVAFISTAPLFSQAAASGPLSLARLIQGLGLVSAPELTAYIQKSGIGFPVNQQNLEQILTAGRDGRQQPADMAALILACLSVCQDCRASQLSPLTKDDLKTLFDWGFSQSAVLNEARVRGVKDLEISEPSANELRAAGAGDGLIKFLMPDDKVPTIPRLGYQEVVLKHAEDYDANAAQGWLKVDANLPADSQNEFVFVHTGLFVKALKGDIATDASGYFNKPAPNRLSQDLIDYEPKLEAVEVPAGDDKKGKAKAKAAPFPALVVKYSEPDVDGRNTFIFDLGNSGTAPERISFTLRWQVRTTPKEPKAALPADGKKK